MNIHPKAVAGAIGGGVGPAVADILVWILRARGIAVPENISDDIAIILGSAIALAAAYLTPSPSAGAPESK